MTQSVHARPQPANVGKSGNAFQFRHAARCDPLGHEDVAIRSEAGIVRMDELAIKPLIRFASQVFDFAESFNSSSKPSNHFVLLIQQRDAGFEFRNEHQVQLYNRGRNVQFLSSIQLIQRLRNPATGPIPVRRQSMALHCRLTRPILCLINIAIALPLVFRKESHSLITNMAVCAAVLGVFYGLTEASFALGGTGLIAADLAAWIPVVVTGVASAWTSGLVQT